MRYIGWMLIGFGCGYVSPGLIPVAVGAALLAESVYTGQKTRVDSDRLKTTKPKDFVTVGQK